MRRAALVDNSAAEFAFGGERRGALGTAVLLVICLSATLIVFHYVRASRVLAARLEFEFVCNEIRGKTLERLRDHEQILRSGVALFETADTVDRATWKVFAESLDVARQLPGIQGFGFSVVVPRDELAGHLQAIRAQGFPDYRVWPEGDRQVYTSIIYLEPFADRNLRAFGYDMLSEPIRREAMERARDQGAAALSGKITLVQETDTNIQAGTLMYLPVYQRGMPRNSVAERQSAHLGWVYSPYRMGDLMEGTLGGWDLADSRRIRLEIFDGNQPLQAALLYDSQSGEVAPASVADQPTLQRSLVAAGREWTLRFTGADAPALPMVIGGDWLFLLGGTIGSFLLSGLFLSTMNTRYRAGKIAMDLTARLRESEESYRNQFAMNTSVMLLIGAGSGEIIDANGAAVKFYGYSREQLLTMNIRDINTMTDDELGQAMGSVMQDEGKLFSFSHRLADGSIRSVEVSSSSIRFGGREVLHSIIQDVTARKEAEESLRDERRRLEAVIEGTHAGTWEWNVQTGGTIFNETWAQIVGYTLEELEPVSIKTWESLTHPDDLRESSVMLEKHFAGELPFYDCECRMRHKDGHWVWVHDRGRLITRTAAGGPLMMFGTHMDVTDRKLAAEAALSHSAEQLERAVKAGHIALWDWNVDDDTWECSDEWCRLLGCSRGALSGRSSDWLGRLHPEDRVACESLAKIAPGAPTESNSIQYRILHADGHYRWHLASFSLAPDTTGRTSRICGASIDITERKHLEADAQQAQKLDSIGRLAGGVAHDFNNLLLVIGGYLEIALAEIPDGTPLHHDLDQVRLAAERAANLTSQLLAFSRRQIVQPQLLNLGAVIQNIGEMLTRMVGEDITITTQFADTTEKILADSGQVEQMLMNLVANARDAMPDGGNLLIRTESLWIGASPPPDAADLNQGPYVSLTVTDSGTGVAPEVLQHLFEPFYTTKERGKGTGLGLATVYGMVQQSGGVISVASEINEGTSFRIYFPRADEAPPAEEGGEHEIDVIPHGSETVLVVEDEDSLAALAKRVLALLGYDVLSASSGEEALQLMKDRTNGVSLLLTDVVMPGMSGVQLARDLSEGYPEMRVLYMSGYTYDTIDHHGVLNAGAHLINKPFRISELARAIRKVLDE